MNTCETCRYYEPSENHWGACHRFPPFMPEDRTSAFLWPETAPKDWCGEWKAAEYKK